MRGELWAYLYGCADIYRCLPDQPERGTRGWPDRDFCRGDLRPDVRQCPPPSSGRESGLPGHPMTSFASRLIAGARQLGPLCVGIDPHPGRIPDLFGGDTPEGVAAWGEAVVAAAAGRACVVKPQVGLFERHGPDGMRALQRVCEASREAGLLVLADAKRGDIGTTARGYAAAYLSEAAPFPSDAVTVNPYMGLDTLEPFLEEAEANGKGVVVLARTSNPGSADFQRRTRCFWCRAMARRAAGPKMRLRDSRRFQIASKAAS